MQISLELERAEKRKDMLEKKEDELSSDEVKFKKEYDITMRMLKSAQAQVGEAIANKDMVEIHRSLSSHGFTVCHTVLLSFSRSHGRLFIPHGFTNLKWIFSQTHNFPRKQTRQHNPLSKNIVALSSTYKKINKSVTFDSETSTKSFPANSCLVNYQKLYDQASI